MKLRVLIADDEPLGREHLRRLLEAESGIDIVAECSCGREALRGVLDTRPHLAFLDIQMPNLDGVQVVESLPGKDRPVIIFVTAHDRFAARAFELEAADYLLKPFNRDRFQSALRRGRERVARDLPKKAAPEYSGDSAGRLTVKSQGRMLTIDPGAIDWISSADNYVELHLREGTHLLRTTLAALALKLPPEFVQISRSVLVNSKRILEMRAKTHGDFCVLLQGGSRLEGTRTYRKNLLTFFRPL